MPYALQHNKTRLPRRAASPINEGQPVAGSPTQTDYVYPVASAGDRILGIALAAASAAGEGVSVQTEGIAICRAAASLGAKALVAVATTNGRVGPAASGAQVVGEAVQAAAAGDYFSVLLRPLNPTA